MNKKNEISLIDCTLRDGGYYNNWDFSTKLVNDYLKTMSKIGIEFIELGFRSYSSETFRGSNWYTTDNYIDSLKLPPKIKIAVMVNASQIINQKNLYKAVKKLFQPKKKSKIYLVRVACHFFEFEKTLQIIKYIKSLGYKVAINLMQVSEQSDEKLLYVSKKLNHSKVDIVYFADSLGSMNSNKIENVLKNLKKNWKGPIGVHMHNNLGEALSNNMFSLKSGVQWIDSTIMGMGRGAGNAQTEYFLIEYNKYFKKKINILPLLELIKKYFIELKSKYNWGPNTFYYLAGIYGIHPTYIQEMISTQFSNAEILAAIDQLKNNGGSKYNVDLVRSEFQKNIQLKIGDWKPASSIKNRDTLLIASGPKGEEYANAIENYIKKYKPYVIAVNTNIKINKKYINIYAACNPLKIIADADAYKKLSRPLAVPLSLLDKKLLNKFKKQKILNFGAGLRQNTYKFFSAGAIVPRLYTLVYALSIATSGKSKKILLAGFDGYGPNDNRNKIINNLFHQYSSSKGSKQIIAVTPTSYTLTYKSIYNLT